MLANISSVLQNESTVCSYKTINPVRFRIYKYVLQYHFIFLSAVMKSVVFIIQFIRQQPDHQNGKRNWSLVSRDVRECYAGLPGMKKTTALITGKVPCLPEWL